MSEEQAAAAEEAPKGQFGIQKIYTKDISFESPNTPAVFQEQFQPQVDVQLSNLANKVADNVFEVVLTVTVTVKKDETTVYLAEVQQAGIFNISGVPEEHHQALVGAACPNILFPYAREAVSDLATRGGFPQLLLAPVNFDALHQQEMQRRQQQGAQGTTH